MPLPSPLSQITSALTPLYGPAEARAIARLVLEEHYGLSHTDILLGRVPANWDPARLARLQSGEPVQYVIGHTSFCGLTVLTDARALIPRPETEGLISLAKNLCSDLERPNGCLLDLCTGSGCIALALKHLFPDTHVEAWDISPDALALARENFALHHLSIPTRQFNLLAPSSAEVSSHSLSGEGHQSAEDRFDGVRLLLSNPPYVLEKERAAIHPNVLHHEPHLALFVPDDDPLLFYRPLAHIARKHLVPGGHIIVECNTAFTDQVANLFTDHGLLNATVHPDCFALPRFVSAQQP